MPSTKIDNIDYDLDSLSDEARAQLQRITTEYNEPEDRIRLSGELAQGDTVVLWLTQRLLNRLVPHLTAWLSQQLAPASSIPSVQAVHEDIVQGFAQQAARALSVPNEQARQLDMRRPAELAYRAQFDKAESRIDQPRRIA